MKTATESQDSPKFSDLGLDQAIVDAVEAVGYETPTPIQSEAIPHLLEGRDLLGQAQTGTGKTAAFCLPLLSRLDLSVRAPQILVLTPTRELALQVSEAMKTYSKHLKGFYSLPIYGGQSMGAQLKALRRGVHAVVGTPGRLLDHLGRGTLNLDKLQTIVLDEADEMLRMGFIDDVETILSHAPEERQVALFSATMPRDVLRIARKHQKNPAEIRIKSETATVDTINQRYWLVSGINKLDALTRVLETEDLDGILIFVRTKTSTVELASRLEARGFACSPMNGDMNQDSRENVVRRLKKGELDIVVATDVAARGLDVDRISHVINFDIPTDPSAYVHRIGRTGRAGRLGEAILFVAPRERRLLKAIERTTRQPILRMKLPTRADVAEKRRSQFRENLLETLEARELEEFETWIGEIVTETESTPTQIAAGLAYLLQLERPLFFDEPEVEERQSSFFDAPERGRSQGRGRGGKEAGMARYRVEVGYKDGLKPGHLVAAISNESGLEGRFIGRIDIQQTYSFVDLPEGMPKEISAHLARVKVCGQALGLRAAPDGGADGGHSSLSDGRRRRAGRGPGHRGGPRGGFKGGRGSRGRV